ncbi:diguanylate cyclase [Pseudodesulfovibrio cashew]|uniref:diguanylate cyclase n=1 Tax=Pseudodesulfovibrio cashew TaxID=2678688 RepID=A0A6I6JFA4_9BACT|nr:diguanylate cyclase [Pseudodesulfovibrio cashew]QGY39688.1 diguanylate cyclase [Pseudodesulfovibrio cashew]
MTLRIGRVDQLGQTQNDQQSSLLAAIARSAEELTSGKGWPDGVIDLMADLGRITRVSRVWIFQLIELTDEYIVQDYPFEWADCPEHVQLAMPRFSVFRKDLRQASEEYRRIVASRQRGEWQSVITEQLEDGEFKDDLRSQNILSMLTIPIIVEGKWWGILGFDDCLRKYHWSDVEIALLRTATYLISNAILRDRLSSRTKQFEILQGITESSAWELDIINGHFWCSPELFATSTRLTDNIHMSLFAMLRRIHPQDRKGVFDSIREHVAQDKTTFREDLRLIRDDGSLVWVEVIAKLSANRDGRLRKLSGIAVEIRQRKEAEEKLRHEANTDPLTGADNRGSFDKRFNRLMRRFEETGKSFSLLLLDVDYFKKVNDTWGHSIGDDVLCHISALCQQNLRGSDMLARIGGEEFAILLPGIDEKVASNIGERIRKDVESTPIWVEKKRINQTVSIGVAGLPADTPCHTRNILYELADKALYAAKRKGRNILVSCRDLPPTDAAPQG